jgi:hypothetical protein
MRVRELTAIDEHGAHWIAGNLRLELASLNKVEMLPWDVWGAGWEPGGEPTDELLSCFDSVAALTVEPDTHLAELRNRYDTIRFALGSVDASSASASALSSNCTRFSSSRAASRACSYLSSSSRGPLRLRRASGLFSTRSSYRSTTPKAGPPRHLAT